MSERKLKKIKFIHTPSDKHWVGNGFHVHSMFQPTPELVPHISPFLLMDYAPPETFLPSTEKRGVGEHPHKGFETVTFVYQGEVSHRDSAGGGGTISPGDVQWMRAGNGVVHEEFQSQEFSEKGGEFEMLQLWVNLPKESKSLPPRYQKIEAAEMKKISIGDGEEMKILAGEMGGQKGPAKTHSLINIFELSIKAGSDHSVQLPVETNTLLVLLRGQLSVNGEKLNERDLGICEKEGEWLEISVQEDAKLLVLNGEPINEPLFAYGPFVMNTREEVMTAFEEYQQGKMGKLD